VSDLRKITEKIRKYSRSRTVFMLLIAMILAMGAAYWYTAARADVWDGTVDTSWYNETSTDFTLTTPQQLAGLAQLVNAGNTFSGKTIKLGNNIDLNNISWSCIGHNYSITFPAHLMVKGT